MDIFEILRKFGVVVKRDASNNLIFVDTESGKIMDVKTTEDLNPIVSSGDLKLVSSIHQMEEARRVITLNSGSKCISYTLLERVNRLGCKANILSSFVCSRFVDKRWEHVIADFESRPTGNSKLHIDQWANDIDLPLKDIYRNEFYIYENDCMTATINGNAAGFYRDGKADEPGMSDILKSNEAVIAFAECLSKNYPGILETVNKAMSLGNVR